MNPIAAIVAFFTERLASWGAKAVEFFSKKAALAALLAAMATMVVVFTSTINGLLSGLVAAAPSNSWIAFGLGLLPSNTTAIVVTIAAAKSAQWVFIWQMNVARSTFEAK